MNGEPIATSFNDSVDMIRSMLPDNLQNPRVGVICGSGLSGLVDSFRDVVLIPYDSIPGFATSTGASIFRDFSIVTRLTTNFCSPWS
jgi:purine-nucleoside phosphorylase